MDAKFSAWHRQLQQELSASNDRSLMIVACAILEDTLRDLVKIHLIESPTKEDVLFGRNGSVSNFSSVIDFAYRIQIIDKNIWTVLHALRKIRNDCAHSTDEIILTASPHRERLVLIQNKFAMLQADGVTSLSMVAMMISTALIASFSSGVWEVKHNTESNGRPFGKYLFVKEGKIAGSIYTRQWHPSHFDHHKSDT